MYVRGERQRERERERVMKEDKRVGWREEDQKEGRRKVRERNKEGM